jgi:hypothetical protein
VKDENEDRHENLGILDVVIEPTITVVRIMENPFPINKKFNPSGFALQ